MALTVGARDEEIRRTCIDVAADFVAAQPGGAGRALARHHPLPDGTCAGCLHLRTPWPCTIATIADIAHRRR